MDWHKELERTVHSLSSAGAGEGLYEAHGVPGGQHFGSSLPSLLGRQGGERSAWVPGYRPPHQWPQMWSHAQVWGDPAFRTFFPDPGQDLQSPAGGFRSPWEGDQGRAGTSPEMSQGSYHSPAHSQGEADKREFSYEQNSRAGSEATFEHPAYTATTAANFTSQSPPGPQQETSNTDDLRPEDTQDTPKDLTCDRQQEEYPRDYSASFEKKKENRTEEEAETEQEYDIIKNMTERYGGETKENDLSKDRSDEDKEQFVEENRSLEPKDQKMEAENVHNEDSREKESDSEIKHKPIKLKIARGEVVVNTALDQGGLKPDQEDVEMKEEREDIDNVPRSDDLGPSWAVNKAVVIQLQEKLETESELKERVSEIVGEDVLKIYAGAVEEAESSEDTSIDNKNVVFLYYAVKNSTNLDISNFNRNELEPLSNLALSVPLMSSLLKFIIKDQSIKEQIQSKIGSEDFDYFESIARTAAQNGDEFLQDETITGRVVGLYHTARNLVLTEAFTRLASLYSKIEHILESVDTTDDLVYNDAVARFKSLVSSAWNQQVIAAEAMKFDFEFLNEVYSFWKRVIARRNKPEKKPKKPLKIKPLPPVKAADTYDIFGRPKRSTRRRNEMVTYDEDIMQDCNIKPGSKASKQEADGQPPTPAPTVAPAAAPAPLPLE